MIEDFSFEELEKIMPELLSKLKINRLPDFNF